MAAPVPFHRLAGVLSAVTLAVACTDPGTPVVSDAWSGPAFDAAAATNVLHVPRHFPTIQAAVDAAEPGDVIQVATGLYHEMVVITTSGIRLHGQGPADDGAGGAVVNADGHDYGFLVQGASDVTIEGFRVEHGHVADISLRGATRTTVRRNVTTGAGHDGIELFDAHDNFIEFNVSMDNLALNACGVNIVAGSKRNVVRHNRVVNNEWGIQIAGATTTDNVIFHNTAILNRGNGIRNLAGASGTIIEKNHAADNGQDPGRFTGGTAAGIRIASGTGIVVSKNSAFGNQLVDVRKDAAADATFEKNRCGASSPDGLCLSGKGGV